jgi:hypothetical protein
MSRDQLLTFKPDVTLVVLNPCALAPRSGGVSGLRVSRSGSAVSLARFDFATIFAIGHQHLGQPRHCGDRTDYLHWLLGKAGRWERNCSSTFARYVPSALPKEKRIGMVTLMQGCVSAALFQPYFVLDEIRFRRRRASEKKPRPGRRRKRRQGGCKDLDAGHRHLSLPSATKPNSSAHAIALKQSGLMIGTV